MISTRTYQDRLDTLSRVRGAGIHVCTGGIVGMGEDESARIGLLTELASMDPHPESVPINHLVGVANTPLGDSRPLDGIEFVRTIATARILMPKSMVRLSAGREGMTEEGQALCLLAGANSIFVGDRLLTTDNPEIDEDDALMGQMGLEAAGREEMEAPARRTTLIGG